MKKRLTDRYGSTFVKGIGLFSLLSLIPGPWNLTDPADSLREDTIAPAGKVAAVEEGAAAAAKRGFPRAARAIGVGAEAFGAAASVASIWATLENIHAYASNRSNCGCDGK